MYRCVLLYTCMTFKCSSYGRFLNKVCTSACKAYEAKRRDASGEQ